MGLGTGSLVLSAHRGPSWAAPAFHLGSVHGAGGFQQCLARDKSSSSGTAQPQCPGAGQTPTQQQGWVPRPRHLPRGWCLRGHGGLKAPPALVGFEAGACSAPDLRSEAFYQFI